MADADAAAVQPRKLGALLPDRARTVLLTPVLRAGLRAYDKWLSSTQTARRGSVLRDRHEQKAGTNTNRLDLRMVPLSRGHVGS